MQLNYFPRVFQGSQETTIGWQQRDIGRDGRIARSAEGVQGRILRAKVQRCQLHVARNILAKVPRKLKKEIADEIRSIFYASSKKKAMEFFEQFKRRWSEQLPSVVKCLEKTLEPSCVSELSST